MGITGLLPFLKGCLHPASIRDYKGSTVAIDSYCWLHKGAFACAEKLASGAKTDQYVYYCMKFVNMLLSHDIKPIMVFDGCRLPSKRDVEKQRRERREMYRKKGHQLLREGKKSEARDCFSKSVDITPQMALELIKACRSKGVDCIVAPYEADSQLAFLSHKGIAQIVITEDSDLIPFGCTKIMFKMDSNGNGLMLNKDDLNQAMDMRADCYTFERFRWMCILSGCDYLSSLPGIGLKKAQKLFQRTRQNDIRLILKKIPTLLNMRSLTVGADYIENFIRADNTFLYQLVYDPTCRKLRPLHDYSDDVDVRDLNYAGPPLDEEKAYQIALGNVDIYTGELMDDFDPDINLPKQRGQGDFLHRLSIWDRNYRPMSTISKSDSVIRKSTAGTTQVAKLPAKIVAVKRPLSKDDELTDDQLAALYENPSKKHCSNNEEESQNSLPENSQQSQQNNTLFRINSIDTLNSQESVGSINYCDTSSKKDRQPNSEAMDKLPDTSEIDTHVNESKSPKAEKLITSPPDSRNKFKVLGPSKKEKFSLNQTKVVSKYFTTEKPHKKSLFYGSLGEELEHPKEKEKPVWERDDESENEMSHQSPTHSDKKSESITNVATIENSPENNSSQSPYNMFGKAKLSSFKSKFDPSIKNSPASSRQFKPVKMVPTEQSSALKETKHVEMIYSAKTPMSDEEKSDDFENKASDDTSISVINQPTKSPASGQSRTPKQPDLPQAPKSDVMTKPSPDNKLKMLSSSVKKSGPGKCRRSGLSKKSPKGSENQSITKFFSSFKRNKDDVERMPKQPLSPTNR